MAYYDALIAKWATLVSSTTSAKLAEINAITVLGSTANKMIVPTYAIYNAIVPSEFVALTAANQQLIRDILAMGTVDASPGTSVRSRVLAVFPNGTTTFTNLSNLAKTYDTPTVSWAVANGYGGPITYGDVAMASLDGFTPWARAPYIVNGPDASGNTTITTTFWDTATPAITYNIGSFITNAPVQSVVDNWSFQIMRTQANRAALAKLIV